MKLCQLFQTLNAWTFISLRGARCPAVERTSSCHDDRRL